MTGRIKRIKIFTAVILSLMLVIFGNLSSFATSAAKNTNPARNYLKTTYNTKTPFKTNFNYNNQIKNGLTGEYYNNLNFTGLKMTRIDDRISFDWNSDSPERKMASNNFSIRWTGQIQPRYTENYTFSAIADEGVRLWVNNQLIIDAWNDQAATEYKGNIYLEANKKYNIRLEYYEKTGDACVKLLWASPNQRKEIVPKDRLFSEAEVLPPPPGSGNGLKGEYYDNINFTNYKLARTDGTINFSWGNGSPDKSIDHETFSVRWTGKVEAEYTEKYTFYTVADDGVRLWVNGMLIIDDWNMHGPTEHSGSIQLNAGAKYDMRLDYFQSTETAKVKMYWSSDHQEKEIVPKDRLYSDSVIIPPPPPPPVVNSNPVKVDLSSYFNEDAFSYDSMRTDGNFDKIGNTYSADLVNASPTYDSTPYSYGKLQNGYVNSIRCVGQSIPMPQNKYESLRLAGSATNGDKSAFVRVNYTDGTSVNYSVQMKDWCSSNAGSEKMIQSMAHRHTTGGDNTINTNIYAYYLSLDKNKTLASITLPDQTDMHILAATLLSAAPAVSSSGNGLVGIYYDNMDFTNQKSSRDDPNINFYWDLGSPAGNMGSDTFSIRWTGKVEPKYNETYTFYTIADDGVRLWVNGTLLIDSWYDQAETEHSGTIALAAGTKYDIRLDYYENTSYASCKLKWSSPSQAKEIIPASQLYH